jgi:hypothetical protein
MNLKYILFILLLSAGCSHLNKISPPTDNWTYVLAEKNDAQLKLTIVVEFKEPKSSDEYEFLFKSEKIEPGDFYVFPSVMQTSLFDGEDGSSLRTQKSYGITSMTKNSVMIEISKSADPSDDGLGFNIRDNIMIPFKISGEKTKKNIRYKWTWKQINPNQKFEPTPTSPVDLGNINCGAAHF